MDNLTSIRRSLQFLVLVALFGTCYFARDLILPIMLGFLLALTLSPLVRGLYRAGIPHAVSGAVLVSLTALLIIIVVGGSAGTVAVWSDELPRMGAEIQQKLRLMTDAVEGVRTATEEVEKITKSKDASPEVIVQQPGLLDTAFDTVTQIGASLIVTLILAMFLLSSGELFYLKMVQAFPTMAGKKRILTTVYNIERRVSRYLLTITLINAGLGLALFAYLSALGMPQAYVWGIAAFLLNFLPYLGGIIGSVLVGAFAIVTFDSIGYALLAPLGYMALTSLEGQVLTPFLVGRRLAMNTVAVFLTVVFWGWLWGIPGALVAVPFLVVFKAVCENFEPLRTIGLFLSSEDRKLPDADEEPDAA
ncbi:AI-2E family transporter [Sulfitobacter sp. G21635-S1]|uniref:AI-2E family transporter n=1 Tax=Sulfitobacter sp. G21635-S1 TaxID=3014043 RepID=UPI0022AF4AB0|nr:AI-2E family transporter [Sulfitobacter sp. G21635-S1]MCZ4256909.1 AI-2E family transporter [Sulfitobacter sp. G21635-S1]